MKAEYINPFSEKCKEIFKQVALVELTHIGTGIKNSPVATKDVVIMIGVTGDLVGNIAINLDLEFAKHIASNMMCGMPVNELDEISMSALKELGNMIMGNVGGVFEKMGKRIDITPPNLMIGKEMILSVAILPMLSLKLKYNNYEMDFDISIKEK